LSASAKNMKAIYDAIEQHNATCGYPAHTILLNPFEIERLGWEEGDTIKGCTVKADPSLGTGAFYILCDKPKGNEVEEETVASDPREKVLV
jgi:hypothetical protein